jgi:hypothetical protein
MNTNKRRCQSWLSAFVIGGCLIVLGRGELRAQDSKEINPNLSGRWELSRDFTEDPDEKLAQMGPMGGRGGDMASMRDAVEGARAPYATLRRH